jgi:flagellin
MPQVINSNIMSLNAQRNLNNTQSSLQTSLERLSSGLRINSAKDDAAGLAITERFTSQIRGLNQAVRNANDAISLAQTSEGALAEYGNNLQRVRELAIQSANATNSASDRQSLNAEVQQLLAEMQRVAVQTSFNGRNVLDGTFNGAQFQIGAFSGQTINVNVTNSQTSALGSYQVGNTATNVTGASLAAGDVTINGIDAGISVSGSAEDIAAAINAIQSETGVSASASTAVASANTLARNQGLLSGDLVINGINVGATNGSNNIATQGANIATAINNLTNQHGVIASADQATGQLSLTSTTGANIIITGDNGDAGYSRVENASGLEVSASTVQASATYTITGTAGASTITFAAQAVNDDADGTTFTIQGTTFEIDTAGAVGVGAGTDVTVSVAANADATAQAAAVVTAINANLNNVTAANAAGVVTVTSDVATSTAAGHTDISLDLASNGETSTATAGNAGIANGDTLILGGITYEFLFDNLTATAGNVKVSLGTSGAGTQDDQATNLSTAIGGQYTGINTNITAAVATNVVTVTADLLGSPGDATVDATFSGVAGVAEVVTLAADGVGSASSNYGVLQLNSPQQFVISGNNTTKAGLQSATSALVAINSVDVSTVAGANSAIDLVDGALSQVASIRATLGAVQNRLQSTIATLSAASENFSAARSRIQDADFAAETAALTRAQILQQAGIAMLSQANAQPQTVLALLQ